MTGIDEQRPGLAEMARRVGMSDRLRQRHMRLLPVEGPGACATDVQGRDPGAPTISPEGLADLISSISAYGVLQPGLAEQLPDGSLLLVAGERRLRACRWGAVNIPDNPHFRSFPAWVCPGPLSEEERRAWQLIENLAREDLQPGELAAALLYERCAMLTTRLLAAGTPVPLEVAAMEDPVQRWRALEKLRASAPQVAAPWGQVLRRLGLALSERKARALVQAFADMPAEMAWDMDAHRIALATRLEWLRLDRGRRAAAAGIWEAVKARGAPQLLGGALHACAEFPDLAAEEAVALAETRRHDANQSRSVRLRSAATAEDLPGGAGGATSCCDPLEATVLGEDLATETLDALRSLADQLRAGAKVSGYLAGSLRLYATEVVELLEDQSAAA